MTSWQLTNRRASDIWRHSRHSICQSFFSREFILGFKVLSPSNKRSLRNKHLVHVFNVIAFSVFFPHMLKNNFIARYYALWKVKVLENVFSGIFVLLCEPYKFLLHILKNNSAAENCINVRLGQVVNLWYQHSIISESFGFRHSTVLILIFDGTKPPIIWFQSIQAKQVGVTVRPHWSSLRLLLRTYERSPCSKSTIRGNLPQVCPYVPSYLNLFLCFRRIFFFTFIL